MSFTLSEFELDFGTTEIENLFINDFMPQANGTHVKVYLYGLYLAKQKSDLSTNETLAKHLNLSLEDVISAWRFWETKGLIQINHRDDEQINHLFEVNFLSIRQVYFSNNYMLKHIAKTPQGLVEATNALDSQIPSTPTASSSSGDRLISAMTNPIIKGMFANIQYLVRRPLLPQEHVRILNWITDFKMDPDMIERAFHITYEERKITDFQFNYVEGIIMKWYDKRILTLEALDAYAATVDQRHGLYKQIYQAIGIYNRQVSTGDKELIDKWCDQHQLTQDFILYVIKEATKRTTNPNLNYLSKVMQNIIDAGDLTQQGADLYFTQPTSKVDPKPDYRDTKNTKKNFQNFKQNTISSMTEDEMKAVLKRKADKKKQTKGGQNP